MKYDALLEAARLDLEAAKKLSKARLFSNSLYNIEQSLEKSSKSLYCYHEITRNKTAEKVINRKLKKFGHNNNKMIPEIYLTICNIEESEIGEEIVVVKIKMKQALQELRKSVCNLIGKPPVDQNTLLKDFIDRVNKAYSNYTSMRSSIKQIAQNTRKRYNLKGSIKQGHSNYSLGQLDCYFPAYSLKMIFTVPFR